MRRQQLQVLARLEGEIAELPDLAEAEKIMEKYKLDEDWRAQVATQCFLCLVNLWEL